MYTTHELGYMIQYYSSKVTVCDRVVITHCGGDDEVAGKAELGRTTEGLVMCGQWQFLNQY